MPILVTGATGLLGSELTRQLLDDGHEVRILRRSTSSMDLLGETAGAVEHIEGSLGQVDVLERAMQNVEEVYHVAAYIGFGGRSDRDRLLRVNVDGTANVVNAALAAGVARLVYTSSMAAFGRPEHPTHPIDETREWSPSRVNSEYARSKHLGELEVRRGIAEGLDAVIVNPALIFGIGRPGDNTRRIAEQVRDGKLPAVPTGGTNVVDVRDVADGHRRAMQFGKTGRRYFLGSENLTWRAIIDTLADAFDVEPPRFTAPPRLALTMGYVAEGVAFVTRTEPLLTRETARSASRFYRYDNARARAELGCSFRPFSKTAAHLTERVA